SWTVTVVLAPMLWPLNRPHVAVSLASLQAPMAWALECRTSLLSTFRRFVLVGKLMVFVPDEDSEPVEDVVNVIEYTVRAPAASEGDVLVTDTLLTLRAAAPG